MTIQQIEYFIAVAECRNFTHAAEQIPISQPTISRQIKLLELELGYPLFQRNARSLTLTESGMILYQGLKNAVLQIEECKKMAQIASEGRSGSLSLGFNDGLQLEYLFIPTLNELKETCGNLRITCKKENLDSLISDIQNDMIDIGFSLAFSKFQEAGLRVERLKPLTTLIIMAKTHSLAKKRHLEKDDLLHETIYLPKPADEFHLEILTAYGLDIQNIQVVEVNQTETAYLNVLTNNGVTLSNSVDLSIRNDDFYHYIELPYHPKYSPHIAAITKEGNINASKMLFLELIREEQD